MLLRWIFSTALIITFGYLNAQNAPITTVQDYANQIPGEIIVPVTVTNFTDIGAISLNLHYDPTVLTYISGVQNSVFNGSLFYSNNPLPSGNRTITIGWFGNSINLPDGASLIDLHFQFIGGATDLTWYDDGGSCEYADGEYNTLNDSPTEDYYINGSVSSNKNLNLSLFIEGLFNPTTNKMNTAVGNGFSDNIADEIQVELHDAGNYTTVVYTSGNVLLSTEGHISLEIPGGLGSQYYITVKHRNSIETVSALPVSFSGNETTFNFSDQASKAYGSNLKLVGTGKWAIFSGDVNQDGSVDTGDMSPVDNDAGNFASGYLPTDVNGDGSVDTGDMTIVDNNASAFVGAVLP